MFPREWKAFSKWRKAQRFQPGMELKAQLVENDLRLLTQLDPVINRDSIAICNKAVEAFAAELDAMKQKAQR